LILGYRNLANTSDIRPCKYIRVHTKKNKIPMNIKNLFGFFSRHSCDHDWSENCEKCSKCGFVPQGYRATYHPIRSQNNCHHYFRGCACIYCGKVVHSSHNGKCTVCGNNKKISQHDFSLDCKRCSKCGATSDYSHKWEGCKCVYCGKIKEEDHDWSKDCTKCSKCGKMQDEKHDWSKDCEKCSKCGKTIANQHDWSKDCERCSKCGKSRQHIHKWGKDCKCTICGKEQHDWSKDCEKCARCGTTGQHDWDGCKCKRCSIKRDEQHDWDGCACKRCYKKRDEQHEWNGCTCKKCYKVRDEHHDWSQSCDKCSICGELVNDNHNWEGCRCSKCSVTRDKGHDFEKFVCRKCGQVDNIAHLFSLQNRSKNNSSEIFSTLSEHNAGILIVQLANGANPNSCLNDGVSAIEVASGFSFLQGVDILLQAGANPNNWKKYPPLNSLLQGAMISNQDKSYCERVIVNLLNKGADPRTTMKDYSGKSGKSPLHYAIENGYIEVVRIFLKKKISPNLNDDIYGKVLHRAVASNWYEIVQLLVEHGADVNQEEGRMLPINYAKTDRMRALLNIKSN
jgi:hypothetical protein